MMAIEQERWEMKRLFIVGALLICFCIGLAWGQLTGQSGTRSGDAPDSAPTSIIGDIAVKSLPSMTAVVVRESAAKYLTRHSSSYADAETVAREKMLTEGYEKLAAWMKNGGVPAGPSFIIYNRDPATTPARELSCQIGYPVLPKSKGYKEAKIQQIPAMTAAVLQYRGRFRDNEGIWDSLRTWIPGHGFESDGLVMEVYLKGMRDNPHPAENLAEIRWQIRPAADAVPPVFQPRPR
jgi:effector-binding domain-containing protein